MRRWLTLGWRLSAILHAMATVTVGLDLAAPGFGRWSIAGFAQGDSVVATDHGTPRQLPRLWLGTVVRGDLGKHARTVVDVRGIWGGPPIHPKGAGFVSWRDTFQDLSPAVELEEAYVEINAAPFSARLGKQKFAWGRLDITHAVDILNPRRFDDPFRIEPEDAKIGAPAAQLEYRVPGAAVVGIRELNAELIWIPWLVPFRFPLSDERWFPRSAGVPSSLDIPPGFFWIGSGATVTTQLHESNAPPALQVDEGSIAGRLSGTTQGFDWALLAYNGAETNPALALATQISAPLAQQKLARGQTPILSDLRQLEAQVELSPRYGRVAAGGGDVAFGVGGATVRAEMLYARNRLIPRRSDDLLTLANLRRSVCHDAACTGVTPLIAALLAGESVGVDLGELFVRRDTVEWGVGADYPIAGWVPLLQINQTLLLDDDDELLVPRVDTRLTLALRRDFLNEQLRFEVVALQGMPRSYTSGMVRWSYALTDAARLRWGYLLLAGTRDSLIGQYQDNDEAFLELRYTF